MSQASLSAFEGAEAAGGRDPAPEPSEEDDARSCVECGATEDLTYLYPSYLTVCRGCEPEGAEAVLRLARKHGQH